MRLILSRERASKTDVNRDERSDYQVYLGNNRGVFDMGHSWLKRSDPRFWGTSLDSSLSRVDGGAHADFTTFSAQTTTLKSSRCQFLASRTLLCFTNAEDESRLTLETCEHSYDLPAMVDHVRRDTNYDKVSSTLSRTAIRPPAC